LVTQQRTPDKTINMVQGHKRDYPASALNKTAYFADLCAQSANRLRNQFGLASGAAGTKPQLSKRTVIEAINNDFTPLIQSGAPKQELLRLSNLRNSTGPEAAQWLTHPGLEPA